MRDSILMLSPGHGGLTLLGNPVTPGKRSPKKWIDATPWPRGIIEGVFNRSVCGDLVRIVSYCNRGNSYYCCRDISAGCEINIGLKQRVAYVNQSIKFDKSLNHYLLCVHANAANNLDANGVRVFVGNNASKKSHLFAQQFLDTPMPEHIADIAKPTKIKTANFYELTKTKCPAVYLECGFMTHENDARILARYDTARQFAQWINTVFTNFTGLLS